MLVILHSVFIIAPAEKNRKWLILLAFGNPAPSAKREVP